MTYPHWNSVAGVPTDIGRGVSGVSGGTEGAVRRSFRRYVHIYLLIVLGLYDHLFIFIVYASLADPWGGYFVFYLLESIKVNIIIIIIRPQCTDTQKIPVNSYGIHRYYVHREGGHPQLLPPLICPVFLLHDSKYWGFGWAKRGGSGSFTKHFFERKRLSPLTDMSA